MKKYEVEILPKYKNSIYEQRELGQTHTPFELEYILYNAIKDGNEEIVKKSIENYLNGKLVIGRLSENLLIQTKYWAVACISVAIHYAILGGLDETDAYNLSDKYIQTVDKFTLIEECIDYLNQKALELTMEVKKSKINENCSKKVKDSIHFIHIHLHEKLSIDDVSNAVSLSKSYLSSLFKKETGISIHKYIQKEKLKASKLMLDSGMAYDEVCYNLAFCSESHFIECFKKEYKMTPSEYKNKKAL